jgi:ABC-type transporter Mla MlaB component
MLRITVQDEPDQVTLKLEGELGGIWVTELEDSWRAVSATLAGRSLCLDLTAVDGVDNAGSYLLALLRRSGVQLIASGIAMSELVQSIARDWPLDH